jgi:DNA-directed RNA polymerase subunit beta
VPERLRGEIARSTSSTKGGKVIVAKDKRITAKHIRDMEAAGIKRISVPEDFLLGRTLAHNVIDPTPAKSSPRPTTRITEDLLKKLREPASPRSDALHQRPRPGPVHLPDAAHRRDRRPDWRAHRDLPHDASRRAADRGCRRGAVQRLFYSETLRPVGCRPHEVQPPRRPFDELTGPMTLINEDILAVIKILVDLRNGKGEIDDIDHLGNRRVRSVGELAENQFRAGLVRVERAVKERLSRPRPTT